MHVTLMSLLYVVFVVAGFSLIYFTLTKFTLPPAVMAVLVCVLGLIGLMLIWNLLVGHGGLSISQ